MRQLKFAILLVAVSICTISYAQTVENVSDSLDIESVTVTQRQRGNYISSESIGKKELISFTGLTKMACCNLAESFENSASVTVGYSDAISGARQIRLLGLAGIYTQILDESRPIMRGLGSAYGLSYTPGMWLQSIQVSKGVSSVISGHEAISGQINLEYRKPTDETPLFLNMYFDQQLRTELNAASSMQLNRKLSTVILAHGSIDPQRLDHNHDGFLDTPTSNQINVANRWLYMADNGLQIRAGVKFVYENREAGQIDFDHKSGYDAVARDNMYGSKIDNKNFNAYVKAAMPVGEVQQNSDTGMPMQSNVALVADYNYYSQSSFFGYKLYDVDQNSLYANLLSNIYLSSRNSITAGLSATVDRDNQQLTDKFIAQGLALSNDYTELGAFGEYNFNYKGKFNLIAGLRADHNTEYGWFWTPRAHLKWNITPRLALRGSAGKGFRVSNFVADNIGILATGRAIEFMPNLDPLEESLTYGGSLTQSFKLGADDNASVSVDVFRTQFNNQIVADQEYNSGSIIFYNPAGRSYTNTYQVDFNWTPATGLDLLATMRYNDTNITLTRKDGTFADVEKPLVDRYKALVNVQYATKFRRWVFDFTAQLNGQSRLPVQNGVISNFEFSPIYPMFFAQVSRKLRKFDVYLGCENIGNYTQNQPIISPDSPFDSAFNASVVWGPLMGRKIYAGFRFNL